MEPLDDVLLADDLRRLDLVFRLHAVHVLDLSAVGLGPGFDLVSELDLLVLHELSGHVTELCVLTNLESGVMMTSRA